MEWFTETLYPSWQQRLGIEAVLYQERTEHQDLVVFRSSAWGTVLALDGVVQTTTGDEWAYHEMLVHPSLIAHGRARSVCIVGGGDGDGGRTGGVGQLRTIGHQPPVIDMKRTTFGSCICSLKSCPFGLIAIDPTIAARSAASSPGCARTT